MKKESYRKKRACDITITVYETSVLAYLEILRTFCFLFYACLGKKIYASPTTLAAESNFSKKRIINDSLFSSATSKT